MISDQKKSKNPNKLQTHGLVPDSYSHRSRQIEEIDKFINKCRLLKDHTGKSAEILNFKPIKEQELNEIFKKPSFTKWPNFKSNRERVRVNIENHLETQNNQKMKKMISVVKSEEPRIDVMLTPTEMENKEAAIFFGLNKRKFGDLHYEKVRYQNKFKPKRIIQKINPEETVLENIKSIIQPEVKKKALIVKEDSRVSYKVSDDFDLYKVVTPKNKVVENEIFKVWPKIDEKQKKENLFYQRMKIKKLVEKNREMYLNLQLVPKSVSSKSISNRG